MSLNADLFGSGPTRVLVLHDWLGDSRNYDAVRPYLDDRASTFAFVDLPGYGRSRAQACSNALADVSQTVLETADALDWPRFWIVAHSMSTLIAQQAAALAPTHVAGLILTCPIAPTGMNAPEAVSAYLEQVGLNPEQRGDTLKFQWGGRLSQRWVDFKLSRWAEAASPMVVARYARLYSQQRLMGNVPRALPILAIVGEHDQEHFSQSVVRRGLGPAYDQLELVTIRNSGHYPMQETPPLFATLVDRFLAAHR